MCNQYEATVTYLPKNIEVLVQKGKDEGFWFSHTCRDEKLGDLSEAVFLNLHKTQTDIFLLRESVFRLINSIDVGPLRYKLGHVIDDQILVGGQDAEPGNIAG